MKRMNLLKRALPIALSVCLVSGGSAWGAPGLERAVQQEEDWSMLQTMISKYYGEWTDTSYDGLFVSTMPKTALLGNGDVGVTSGGDGESKTFYISKGDFWAYRGSPMPIGGITIQKKSHGTQAPDPQTNSLAYQKPVTSSADHPGFSADRAVNGQWSGGYEGWVSPVGNPQWMAVDLGTETTFNRFVVRHDAAARPNETANVTQSFKLQTSADGSNWTDVYTVTGNHDAITDITLPLPVTARYARLYIMKGTQETTSDSIQNPRTRIGQFELYNNPDLVDQQNTPQQPEEQGSLTLNKTVTASGSHYTLTPDRAINGAWSPNSGYEGWTSGYHGDGQPGPWWLEVDLGESKVFNRFVVQHDGAARPGESANNTKDFELQTRNSAEEEWQTAYQVEGNTSATTDVRLDESVTARYVRLYITTGTQGTTDDSANYPRARIGQFELFNEEADAGGEQPQEPEENFKVYDLGGSFDLSRYVIRLGHASSIGVEASEDGISWAKIGEQIGSNGKKVIDVTTDSFTARYIRVTADKASTISQLSAFETPGLNRFKPEGKLHEIQNILDAQVQTEMEIAGTPLSMKTWTSATENVIITELTSEGTSPIDVQAQLWAKSGNAQLPVTATSDGSSVTVTRQTTIDSRDAEDANAHVSKAALTTKVIGADGVAVSSDADKGEGTIEFALAPGQTVYLVTAVGGGGRTYNSDGELLQAAEPEVQAVNLLHDIAGAADIQALHGQHLDWWKNFWLTSYITMDTTDPKLDTLMKYYYAAQYVLGSSIREDKVAPGLYSIWHTTDGSQWSSDYHMNYNFIATFYGVNSSNRAWMGLPAIDAILDYAGEGAKNAASTDHLLNLSEGEHGEQVRHFVEAKIAKGDIDPTNGIADALLYPVSIGPWGMKLERSYSYYGQLLDAIFSTYTLIEYYDYTQDENFLPVMYDYLKQCLALYEAWLEKEDGKYVLYSAYNEGSWGRNSAVELAVLKNTLSHAIKASSKLNIDAGKREQWQSILDNLAPQPTATYAGKTIFSLAEKHWNNNQWEDLARPIPWDGNILPMENVVPGDQIGYYSPNTDLQVAHNTISVFVDEAIGGGKNGAWSQYNNFPKIFANAVKVRYPAQEIVDNFARTIEEQMKNNLTITDDSDFHGAEKSGATEAINSMLLLSNLGVMKVFPNWLEDRDAEFKNLRAKGAFVVSSAYRADTQSVQYVDLTSEAGQPVTIASPWESGIVVKDANGSVIPTAAGTAPNHAEEITYTFNTTKGMKYHIVAAGNDSEGPGGPVEPNPGTNNGSSGNSGGPVTGGGNGVVKAPEPTVDAAGLATTSIDAAAFQKAVEASKSVRIEVPAKAGAKGYAVKLPAGAFADGASALSIKVATDTGTIQLYSDMLKGGVPAGSQYVTLILKNAVQEDIGNRPAVEISIQVDGAAGAWSNPDSPIAVSIPYAPTAAELADAEHIVVWQIDEDGNRHIIPTGKYDPATGNVTFKTTVLGTFAVGFVHKSFSDLNGYGWAQKAIEVMASKGVINGVSPDAYIPSASVKRADFILLLVRALGLSGTANGGSFTDVPADAYYADAVAIAKKLGIVNGVGNGQFNPEQTISRQDMMVMIDLAMAAADHGLEPGSAADLTGFKDNGSVASYAAQSAATLVKSGIVEGSGEQINPRGMATRAEAAVLIYRIYNAAF
ncbi:discoidin domain-containing protein [Paenibacillus radicis (ex Gao et al. 2016)]|nr:discoidin domain-containing protein [Paenibacillus radicis (ex Gao et al. 2016)]